MYRDSTSNCYRLDTAEFLGRTMQLSVEETGALLLLLLAVEPLKGLPNDSTILRQIARTARRKWKRVWLELSQYFVENDSGRLVPRYLFEQPARLRAAEWMSLRRRVFERDGMVCQYCGTVGVRLECDHIHPVSRGGGNDIGNLTTACRGCNRSKKDKTVAEWLDLEPEAVS